jgi:Protein of unknown function (DUF1501)
MSNASKSHRALAIDRRRLLQAGGLGCFGLGYFGLNLPGLFEAAAAQAAATSAPGTRSPIKSCIFMFCYGGPSHHDTWDMKPAAPREVRGEFQSIATRTPGLRICEHLPHSAGVTDKLAILRGMHHPMRNHNSAAVEALCGRTPLKGDLELLANDPLTDFPCYGSALARLLPARSAVPAHVALPHVMYNVVMLPGQTAGFLGAAYEPLQVNKDPNAAEFCVSEIELPGDMKPGDLAQRQALLHGMNAQRPQRGAALAETGIGAYYDRAFALLQSDRVQRGFQIGREDPRTRERYGRNILGQSALLARRLVEAGVRFVSVHDKVHNGLDNWDTHVNNFGRLKDQLLPPCDRAFATLVTDLDERGLLDSTLVVWLGEFGRTPRINRDGGRDHWPDCFSVVLAGGGLQGGATYGASDKIGAYPDNKPVTPGDLAATIFWRFGLDPATRIHDSSGRAYRLAEGEPIRALFAAAS